MYIFVMSHAVNASKYCLDRLYTYTCVRSFEYPGTDCKCKRSTAFGVFSERGGEMNEIAYVLETAADVFEPPVQTNHLRN